MQQQLAATLLPKPSERTVAAVLTAPLTGVPYALAEESFVDGEALVKEGRPGALTVALSAGVLPSDVAEHCHSHMVTELAQRANFAAKQRACQP